MIKNSLARKRWMRLAPVVFITYSLAYIDRANFGFAAAGGMAEDLNLTPSMLSLLGSLFFLGYFFFQIPGTLYAANKSTKKLIFWSCILWGSLASATGIINNVTILYYIRFTLGVVESAVWPALILLLSRWFTRSERSKANTFLTLGNPVTIIWMSILSGYLIESLGWRWMFILEGLPAIIWAIFWWFLVDDYPRKAKWLSDKEKDEFELQLSQEQEEIKPVKNYAEAFKSKTAILLCLQYGFWSIGAYGFIMWLPSIIKAAPEMSIVMTGWLSALPYVLAIIGMFITSYLSDKTLDRKSFIWPFLLIGSLALYGSYWVGPDSFGFSMVLLIIAGAAIYIPYAPFFTALTEIFPSNVSAGAIALINSFGALGSFAGSYIVGYLNGSTQGFGASYLFMAACLLLSALLTMLAIKNTKSKKSISKLISGDRKVINAS
ncbi:MFS transporter [Algoriphagus sp.]|uniref:MFS transporter n=1 Tax=Algoriphagus sp. TaxID=1872435 RepID=UPI003F6E8574